MRGHPRFRRDLGAGPQLIDGVRLAEFHTPRSLDTGIIRLTRIRTTCRPVAALEVGLLAIAAK